MKKTLVVLAALAATSAFAQSTVALTGSISTGIMNTGAAGAKTGLAAFGSGANAININTVEDMGGGMKAGFSSQMRFNPTTGDSNSAGTGNALFHAANVYVEGKTMGNIRVGKIAEASNCSFDPWACGGGAAMMAGGAGLSALVGASAIANAVQYTTPTISGFSAAYLTSMTQPTERANERKNLSLNYNNGPLTIGYIKIDGNANTNVNGTGGKEYTAAVDEAYKAQSLGVAYKIGASTVRYVNAKTETAAGAKANYSIINATVPLSGPFTLLAAYNKAKTGTGYTATAAADTKTAVGVNYALSKRTTLGADVFKAEKAGDSTGYTVRLAHTF